MNIANIRDVRWLSNGETGVVGLPFKKRLAQAPWHLYYGLFKYGYPFCCVRSFVLLCLADMPPAATMKATYKAQKDPSLDYVPCAKCLHKNI